MHNFKYLFSLPRILTSGLLAILICCPSCKREVLPVFSPSSILIVNAIPGSQPIIPVIGTTGPPRTFTTALTINYGASRIYSSLAGVYPFYVVQRPDTSLFGKLSLFNGTLTFAPTTIYSLFLSGDTTQVDTLLNVDNIPYYTDTASGARFVNLAHGNLNLSVNIKGDPTQQAQNLSYKTITPFIKFPAGAAVTGKHYLFEIRNQATNAVLLTYTWNYTPFRNQTLLIAGNGNSKPMQIFSINNF